MTASVRSAATLEVQNANYFNHYSKIFGNTKTGKIFSFEAKYLENDAKVETSYFVRVDFPC